jgi:S-methylmethionine-dependent homocysteine/selenocysteine methylase
VGGYDQLMERIANGDRILIDGATGTEIERRGVPQLENAWNGGGASSHPDVLRSVHEDYIREGAEIVISNTFATHRHALRDAGVEHQFEMLNRRGVELAIEARERMQAPDVLVAGGISYWSWLGNWPAPKDLPASTEEQASIMAQAGADLLMLEMMVDIDRMLGTLEAAQASGLPVWVGLSCKPDESGAMILLRGGPLAEALASIKDKNVPLVSIMHTEVGHIDACLDIVDDHWPGPVGVYAHSARREDQVGYFDATISPDDYAAHAKAWLERGVQVVGGCCGLGVDHIKALKRLF